MSENNTNKTISENANNLPRKPNTSKIIIITALTAIVAIAVAVFGILYITNQNSKKLEQERATNRIDQICDSIMNQHILNIDYNVAKQQISEVKTLIDENNLEGLPVTKYRNVSEYLNDINLYNKISEKEISLKNFKEINADLERIKSKKVREFILDETGIIYELVDCAKESIIAKSMYKIQEKFYTDMPDCLLVDIVCLDSTSSRGDYTGAMSRRKVSCIGVHDTPLKNGSDTSGISYFTTEILTESLDEIDAVNDGYAFVVVYRDPSIDDDAYSRYSDDYWRTGTWFWYVGFDISAEYQNSEIIYKIARHSANENSGHRLNADEVMNYELLNVS